MPNLRKLYVGILCALSLSTGLCFAVTPGLESESSLPGRYYFLRQEQTDSTMTVAKSPTGAMLRSLFVPGWGQLYNGKWFKAILVCGVEVGLITNAVYQNQMAVQSVSKLEREWYQDNRNLSVWWLLATVLLSMADAYVDAHLYNFDESPDLSIRLQPLNFSYQKEFFFGFSIAWRLSSSQLQ